MTPAKYLNEATNWELKALAYGGAIVSFEPTHDEVAAELDRVADIILNNVQLGVVLEYWYEREDLLNTLLDIDL